MSTDSVYFWKSIRAFVWIYSQLQIHTMLYVVFCNRKEDMQLYHINCHIFKLIILLFGLIMMFDTGMFLLSFYTDYSHSTSVENINFYKHRHRT